MGRHTGYVEALWTQPVIRWQTAVDSGAERARLVATGELIAAWPPAPFEPSPTEWFNADGLYWLWQVGIGGVRFSADPPDVLAYPSIDVDSQRFEQLVERCWLPAIYPLWGRQVLHATAIASRHGDVIAFTGPTHAGKSTMAYGIGKRAGWRLICDDTLGFSVEHGEAHRNVMLHRLKNEARLRPASAEYYGKTGFTREAVEWPDRPLSLKAIYVLGNDESLPQPAEIRALRPSDGYGLLLQQAYALSLTIPLVTQRLMRDYLDLTALVPTFRLTFRRGFDIVEQVFDAVEGHAATLIGADAKFAAT